MGLQAITGDPLDRFPAEDRPRRFQLIENMKERDQITDNWCWAASVESLLATCCAPLHRRQREIVAEFLPCCPKGCQETKPIDKCDERIDQDRLQDLWQKEGFLEARYVERRVCFGVIQEEIGHGRPVQVDLGHRHVILVYGWEILPDDTRRVYIVDSDAPSRKPHVSFDDIDDYPMDGRWGDWSGTVLGLHHK